MAKNFLGGQKQTGFRRLAPWMKNYKPFVKMRRCAVKTASFRAWHRQCLEARQMRTAFREFGIGAAGRTGCPAAKRAARTEVAARLEARISAFKVRFPLSLQMNPLRRNYGKHRYQTNQQ